MDQNSNLYKSFEEEVSISRKEKYKSPQKSKSLIYLDKLVNKVSVFMSEYGIWILLSILFGTLLALPGWIDIISD